MTRLLVFGASTSSTSINARLARHAAGLLENVEPTHLDLNDFDMPLFSVDREADGYPEPARRFSQLITDHQAIVVSVAEHNGTYTAAFKNILDWASRLHGGKLWQKRPMLVLSTSPGGRGGATAHGLATTHWPFMDGEITASFSLPRFQQNFTEAEGVTDPELHTAFLEAVRIFQDRINAL